jgi:hypothetical protein
VARPKRFELLTPRFVVLGSPLIWQAFIANRAQNRPSRINGMADHLQTRRPLIGRHWAQCKVPISRQSTCRLNPWRCRRCHCWSLRQQRMPEPIKPEEPAALPLVSANIAQIAIFDAGSRPVADAEASALSRDRGRHITFFVDHFSFNAVDEVQPNGHVSFKGSGGAK